MAGPPLSRDLGERLGLNRLALHLGPWCRGEGRRRGSGAATPLVSSGGVTADRGGERRPRCWGVPQEPAEHGWITLAAWGSWSPEPPEKSWGYLFRWSRRKRKVSRLASGSDSSKLSMQLSFATGSERAAEGGEQLLLLVVTTTSWRPLQEWSDGAPRPVSEGTGWSRPVNVPAHTALAPRQHLVTGACMGAGHQENPFYISKRSKETWGPLAGGSRHSCPPG